ncbi:SipW-dependent-type signal peptide-containing protein [Halorubrum rutilum]|uniref:SipW-dependent-type signal peptide-containing protein n=1 Tax=Halorubrum rutilum TaxID=1364933 RepID=A0ABD6AP23_9EURY|nr:SipW-dependent-type signal peptide-containing protein [Halorubrum rutilum]
MLVGLGAVGVASAGAGLGTTAYFNDSETFENNTLTAGQLDLAVEYQTSYEQGSAGSGGDSGTINGNPTGYEYVIDDVKPGDSGRLVFCPQIVDNPAWLWVGTENGLTDYENGLTEPEAEVDDTDPADAGTVGSPNDGAGEGDLSEAILVTVSYCEFDDETESFETIRTLNNPEDYTLGDLAAELESGFLLDAGTDSGAYPASSEFGEQAGPCLCIDWNVPTSVENEIQTDAVTFDFSFHAEQERHNESPDSPFLTVPEGNSTAQ